MQTVASALSLPAWECGLKCNTDVALVFVDMSLPAWECGLKSIYIDGTSITDVVTPCVGVWIEIETYAGMCHDRRSHSLRGSVD